MPVHSHSFPIAQPPANVNAKPKWNNNPAQQQEQKQQKPYAKENKF